MEGLATRGGQRPLTLSFVDDELERQYQLAAGRESLNGFRAIALASGIFWAPAAFLLPTVTDLEPAFAIGVGLAMSALGFVTGLAAPWARTLDRQHALATLLTGANGLVIVTLALIGAALPGYGFSALVVLFTWGFVSRTRFIYAVVRTAVLVGGFLVAVALYTGPANLILDVLLLSASAMGTLIALRIFEGNRRRLFFQELLIREQSGQLQDEMAKSERLILNILPESVAIRLRNGEESIADDYQLVTVLFADIVGFTPMAARRGARELVTLLSGLFSAFDELVADRGLEKIKTIGDSYMAVGGLTENRDDHAVSVVGLGIAMLQEAARHEVGGAPLQLRVGVHSGPVVGGVIGTRKLAFDLWGDTVNVASRLEGLGTPGRVHVSEATWKLIGHEFESVALGDSELRGRASMPTFSVTGPALRDRAPRRPDADGMAAVSRTA
jgi:class 3 adenylate cyclase